VFLRLLDQAQITNGSIAQVTTCLPEKLIENNFFNYDMPNDYKKILHSVIIIYNSFLPTRSTWNTLDMAGS